MTREGLRKYEFYLHPDVMDIILEVSAQRDLQLDKGLSQIVQEWKAGIERKPLSTKSPKLSELLDRFDDVDKRLKSIQADDFQMMRTHFIQLVEVLRSVEARVWEIECKLSHVNLNTNK